MRSISLLLLAAALAGCATAPQSVGRSAEAQAELQQLIAGRVAGAPVSCLPPAASRSANMVVIDDSTIAFRNVGGKVYVNNVRTGGCSGLSSGFYTLVTKSHGIGMCSGDIAQVVDAGTGTFVGTCALGDFTPYRRS